MILFAAIGDDATSGVVPVMAMSDASEAVFGI
jgi:hypothetical protein